LGLIRALGLAAAVVGLVSALFTLAVRQAWAALAGGLIVCACLLMTTAGSTGTLPDEVLAVAARLAGSALFVGGFLALWGTGSMPASASGPWQGLSAMTLLAGLVSIIGWRVGVPDLLAASLGDLAPVFLCGVGLPLAAVAATRQLVVERAEARSLAARQSATVADQAIRLQQQAELQAVAEERKRFARDIHDGIGGQLVSLLWRARYEPIPQAEMVAELEQGIADLRLVVDALDEGPVSLQVALSNFAHRARQQLDAAGVAFTWDIPLDFDLEWSDPRRILSFYRVLQESVSNVVRHARATSMSIRVTCPESREGGHLRVEIADNGIGFDPDRQVGGRGLANLRSRTSALGGTLHLQSAQGKGTTILIDLPSEAGPSRLESADPENSPTSVGST
ncbi:MAG: ATP-binding protein, partial [Hyphomonadaceae bacterium]|nr:ATP-binding protein [Hyphomonadaceae bacterium]